MDQPSRLKPALAILLLSISFVFLYYFIAPPFYSVMHEEYRRCAVELPGGPAISWQEYEGYPFNWQAAFLTLISMSFFTLPLAAIGLFAGRLFILMLFWLKGKPRNHQLTAKIVYIIIGTIISLLIGSATFQTRIEEWGSLPIREMGCIASLTFLFLPFWLPRYDGRASS